MLHLKKSSVILALPEMAHTVTVLWIENISVNMSTYKLSIMRESIFISTLHI